MKGEDIMTRLIAAPVSQLRSPSGKQVAAERQNEDTAWRRFLIALLRSLSAFSV
jgi:hypothetical protein